METFISTNGHLSWTNLKNNVVFSLWSHHELSFSENALDFLCWLPWGTWGKPWLMAPTEPASLVLVLFFFRAGLAVTSSEGKAKNIKQRLFGDPDIPKAGGIPKVVKSKWWTCFICWIYLEYVEWKKKTLRKPHVAARRLSRPFWLLW